MPDAVNDTTSQQEPWDKWNLTPYVPESDPLPPVSLCVSSNPPNKIYPQIVAYGEVAKKTLCDRRMSFTTKRERGKFGRSSPMKSSAPCQRRAIVQVLYDDGSIVVRCKEHAPH